MAEENTAAVMNGRVHGIVSVLSSPDRDFLDQNNGDQVRGIPDLVIIDEAGRVSLDGGVDFARQYGAEAYPFTSERKEELMDMEEEARKNQTLKSILVHSSQDFVLSSDGNKVPVSELKGKMVGICFWACEKLLWYFEQYILPVLVIIGSCGKTLHSNVAEAVEEYGVLAYPFTPEKFAELAEIEKAREEAQTLESVLVSSDLDYVIGKEGA
ncbi:hypothetical protein CRG98_016863 [Punica granatum]|uniref:Uncharacterized protein n=1 Tax=Punica granatum TaxID=22663 RepID=A0A2I0K2J0_PUNGR|nr:hypothetical protein CRG98_016863 [Punica granatum]